MMLLLSLGAIVAGCNAPSKSPDPTPLAPSANAAPAPKVIEQPSARTPQVMDDPVVARINARPITLSQIQPTLIEGYGLNVLLNIVQLDLAKQEAARAKVTASEEDFQRERDLTLSRLFPDAEKADYEQLFDQFLQQQRVTRAEFDLVLHTNAYLRKVAEPMVKDKITEEALQEAFRQLYGETVQVRHIQLTNLQEVLEAKRRLAGGEPFEKVAVEMSRNARTAGLGGELPPFSRQAGGYPQAFKDTAFALKEGEVSDAVQAEGAYHLIKLERRIAPKAVKFEDVKESLREELLERFVQATIKQLRTQLSQDAVRGLIVEHPVLKEQYEARVHQRDQQIRDRDQIKEQFERERQRILDRAATQQAATQPTTLESLTPEAPEVARPPATKSEAATQGASDVPATVPSNP